MEHIPLNFSLAYIDVHTGTLLKYVCMQHDGTHSTELFSSDYTINYFMIYVNITTEIDTTIWFHVYYYEFMCISKVESIALHFSKVIL